MPSKNMLPKGKRRQSVRGEYRRQRTLAEEQEEAGRKRAEEELFARGGVAEDPVNTSGEALIDTADMMEAEPTLEERIATNDWITTRGASGSKVAEETYDPPRYANRYAKLDREAPPQREIAPATIATEGEVRSLTADIAAKDMRLDAYLAKALPDVSRAHVRELIDGGHVRVEGVVVKASHKLRGGERIAITGEAHRAPLRAEAEDIPLDVVYEDDDLAVINKPAGMMVHAGSGSTEHNRGTLVNALLYRFGAALSRGATVLAEEDAEEAEDDSEVPQETPQPGSQAALRPGIVHRLDKQTSGLIVVAKNDSSHRRLVESFAERRVKKTYLALSHGWIAEDEGTIELAVGRDATRRTRMTTRRNGLGMRHAVSHWRVLERLDGPFGRFTLAEVRIETGRTHQIRVHLQSIGHAVVGDTLYGSPAVVKPVAKPGSPKASRRVEPADPQRGGIALERNFLHAAELELTHPRTGKALALKTELPPELERVLEQLRGTS